MPDILSQDEIDALLSATGGDPGDGWPAASKTLTPYKDEEMAEEIERSTVMVPGGNAPVDIVIRKTHPPERALSDTYQPFAVDEMERAQKELEAWQNQERIAAHRLFGVLKADLSVHTYGELVSLFSQPMVVEVTAERNVARQEALDATRERDDALRALDKGNRDAAEKILELRKEIRRLKREAKKK